MFVPINIQYKKSHMLYRYRCWDSCVGIVDNVLLRLLGRCSDGFGDQKLAMGDRLWVHIMKILHHHRDLGEVFPSQSMFVFNVADKHCAICLQESVKIKYLSNMKHKFILTEIHKTACFLCFQRLNSFVKMLWFQV